MNNRKPLPLFVKAWMITDIVFCIIRMLIVALGIIGIASITSDDPAYQILWYELISNVLIVLVGLPAAILILNHQKIGVLLGHITLLFVGISFAVSILQIITMFGAPPPEIQGKVATNAYLIVQIVVAFVTLTARLTLAGFYFAALRKANRFFNREPNHTPNDSPPLPT